jgi:hypothetical protein
MYVSPFFTDHEDPYEEYSYSSTLFLDLGHYKGVRSHRHAPAAFYPQGRTGSHCTGG